jgi:hypothetical protein
MSDHHSSLTWGALAMTSPPMQPGWNQATTPLRLIVTNAPDRSAAAAGERDDPFDAPLLQDTDDGETTRASTVLTFHTRSPIGLCTGCQHLYGQLKPHPCEQARWASAVLQQHAATAEEAP